jgi:hypothetical protein
MRKPCHRFYHRAFVTDFDRAFLTNSDRAFVSNLYRLSYRFLQGFRKTTSSSVTDVRDNRKSAKINSSGGAGSSMTPKKRRRQ